MTISAKQLLDTAITDPNTRKDKRPTLGDIAQKCNVTSTTVSLVLKGLETNRVSSATRAKITKVARDLCYRPNRVAQALSGKESGTLGLVLNTLKIPFYAEIAQEIIAHAKEAGYGVLVGSSLESSGSHKSRIDDERQVLLNLIDRGVDGLIICSALREDPVITEIENMGIPFVLALREVKRGPKAPSLDYIGTDNQRGGYLLGEHVLKMGHRRIAIVTGDMEATSAHDRLSGTLQAFKDYGVDPDPELIVNGEYSRSVSYGIIHGLLEKGKKFTAIISHSDIMAIGVLEALGNAGIRVPKEVAVVGFDNSEMAGLPAVELTTIAQERALLGKLAVEMLVEKIKNPTSHLAKRIILNPVLVIRKTCGFHEKKKVRAARFE
jgi:DNA-binding LacI/PurR family transcriptional regulator